MIAKKRVQKQCVVKKRSRRPVKICRIPARFCIRTINGMEQIPPGIIRPNGDGQG
jgi:hypothetical protein